MSCRVAAQNEAEESHASRASSAPVQRRHNSRSDRRMKFSSSELHELVIASDLVPTGRCKGAAAVPKSPVVFDAVSTAVPSSAEQSPELPCMISDFKAWPSLPKPEDGWNFCAETSDIKDIWEDLPEPAVALEVMESKKQADAPSWIQSMASWWLVPGSDSTEPPMVKTSSLPDGNKDGSKETFADLLRDLQGGPLPSACGTLMPAIRAQSLCRNDGAATVALDGAATVADDSIDSELQNAQRHGYTNHDKASWNTKQLRKVAGQKARRFSQSSQTRGLMGSLEDEA